MRPARSVIASASVVFGPSAITTPRRRVATVISASVTGEAGLAAGVEVKPGAARMRGSCPVTLRAVIRA